MVTKVQFQLQFTNDTSFLSRAFFMARYVPTVPDGHTSTVAHWENRSSFTCLCKFQADGCRDRGREALGGASFCWVLSITPFSRWRKDPRCDIARTAFNGQELHVGMFEPDTIRHSTTLPRVYCSYQCMTMSQESQSPRGQILEEVVQLDARLLHLAGCRLSGRTKMRMRMS